MDRSRLPLNALRAFEASARHLSFTRAALELCVTQAAVSHQIKALEDQLGAPLFRRLPRGLALTDEGAALAPSLTDAFERIEAVAGRIAGGHAQVLTIGVVATFAAGWLLPRLPAFEATHPGVDVRVLTNNNRVDLAGDGLDLAIRYGDGAWHGTEAVRIMAAPLTPLCAPALARQLETPADVLRHPLLRSFRPDEWARWFAAAGLAPPPRLRGPMFDTSLGTAQAAAAGLGIGLLPLAMFTADLAAERLVQPFGTSVTLGSYWLTRLHSRVETGAMTAFRTWLGAQADALQPAAAAPIEQP